VDIDRRKLLGRAKPPVIKWLADPSGAFDHLSRYGLDALLRMGAASLWRRAGTSVSFDDRSLDLSFVLGRLVADIVGVKDHDRALMAPKLLAKSVAMARDAPAESVFKVRAVAQPPKPLPTSNSSCLRASLSATSRYIIGCGCSRPTSLASSPRGKRRTRSSAHRSRSLELASPSLQRHPTSRICRCQEFNHLSGG
jgi:hypothetical protein